MKAYHIEYQQDMLLEMLKQTPLEQPSHDFTKKVMNLIQNIEVESRVYFYQKSLFISLFSIGVAVCFLLFYNADFSFSVFSQQLYHYYLLFHNYVFSLNFIPRQITFSPLIVAPLLLTGCIFIADRMLERYKRRKQHQVFCI